MVSTTASGRPLKSAASCPGATHGGSTDLDAGAIWCRDPERGDPSSEECAKEGLSQGKGVRETILRGTWDVVRARRPHDWASPGCGQRAVTWTACDSRGGDGGRAVTCGVIVYLPTGWCTRQPHCCPCRLARACLAGTAVRLDALPTTLGS